MNVKKKLADTKAKLKKNAPQIALIGTAVAGIAYAVYSTAKSAQEVTIIPRTTKDPSGEDEVVVMISYDELKRVAEGDSYELTHLDRDLFHLKETKN